MKKKILIIEDEDEIRYDLVKALSLSGYDAYSAINGEEGIEKAIRIHPNLIISDIMMPKTTGHGVLQKLQSNPNTSHIPFLFLSAKSDKVHIREGMTLGADDFITKPYDLDELLNAVDIRIKKSENIESIYAEKINNLRSSFSKSVPHEIRTPLNIILGLSDYIIKNFDNIEIYDFKEMLLNINDSGKRLQRLFENYLFYSNLEMLASNEEERKQITSDEIACPENIIKETINYIAEQYSRNIDIKIDVVDKKININEKYFVKIIEELIDNACKFSEKGTEIKIRSFLNESEYIIEIHDKGRGMTSEDINNIGAYIQFERNFYEQQGNGLGLSIVKKITELHDGNFKILSEKDKYTKVIVSFPISD